MVPLLYLKVGFAIKYLFLVIKIILKYNFLDLLFLQIEKIF